MRQNKTAAIIPSKGIGDALLMMVASHRLLLNGYKVTTFHEGLIDLEEWFPGHQFKKRPSLEQLKELSTAYDLLIVQNDNSEKIAQLLKHAREKCAIFYPTYRAYKHAPLTTLDHVFAPEKSMVENIALSIAELLHLFDASKDNGLRTPATFVHRKYPKRIVIHPTSSVKSKNWPPEKFIALAHLLKERHFSPVFVVSNEEKKEWTFLENIPLELQTFNKTSQLAAFLYESCGVIGNDSLLGHLGSNLNIPTIVIADNAVQMQLWRPDWLRGQIVTPSRLIPNLKFFRIREKWWGEFISPKKILAIVEKNFR